MKYKFFAFSIFLHFFQVLSAQSGDFYKTDEKLNKSVWDSIEKHVVALNRKLPDSYRGKFMVYDFAFEGLSTMLTETFPDDFINKRAAVEKQTPNYLLFGRQVHQGQHVAFWIDLKLPECNEFQCLTPIQFELLKSGLGTYAYHLFNNIHDYSKCEIAVMDSLSQKLAAIADCCTGKGDCIQCPATQEVESYFSSGYHGTYSAFDIFITDSVQYFPDTIEIINNIEDLAGRLVFHQDEGQFLSAIATAHEILINENLNDSPDFKVKIFITDNENFCNFEISKRLANDFLDTEFSMAIHMHYFKNEDCTDPSKRCDWTIFKYFYKRK